MDTYINFNSSMVQLKDVIKNASMPDGLFQFLYGTIKRGKLVNLCSTVSYFNSSMVQLKVVTVKIRHHFRLISIPLWYN